MFYNLTVVGIDVLRIWIGPLPPWLCRIYIILLVSIWNSFTLILFTMTVIKFVILWILKRMPEVNDELATKVIIGSVCGWTMFECIAKFDVFYSAKPVVNEVNLLQNTYH